MSMGVVEQLGVPAAHHASALVGNTARLRCRIDGKSCGEMHSVKWYKADSRVYVYSASKDAAINRPEGDMMDRHPLPMDINFLSAHVINPPGFTRREGTNESLIFDARVKTIDKSHVPDNGLKILEVQLQAKL
ncbi:hypothetical protein RR46_07900 [Papilio xuthus]|uniref:Ig-like domain-containing protein n=1 Tax=Papilio xuthus TaxID=66420 RepID=A0A194QL21_PAPXU|nr:hypothetical protein RR46_07900 [Papilio xuthus]